MNNQVISLSTREEYLENWTIFRLNAEGRWQEIARHRFRGDAESYASALNKALPGRFKVVFDDRRINQRRGSAIAPPLKIVVPND